MSKKNEAKNTYQEKGLLYGMSAGLIIGGMLAAFNYIIALPICMIFGMVFGSVIGTSI